MLKNNTSLIIVCVFIGILICHFTMCGCKSNYSLIEGMTGEAPPAAPPAAAAAPVKPPMPAPKKVVTQPNPLADSINTAKSMTGSTAPALADPAAPASSNTTAVGAKSKGPAAAGAKSVTTSAAAPTPAAAAAPVKETFQQQGRPLEYGSLHESKSDELNFSKWVKDAMRYAKGMGNENRLDSYQYNTGPKIPLPEGEMFFFKDTKFSPNCCPSTYSSSLGCACLSKKQFNYLMTRGGNNNIPAGCKNSGCNASYYNEY
jgi:hypothetical protein